MATTTWQIDPAHSVIGFEAKHLMISKVRGRFGAVTGTLVLDEDDVTKSTVTAEIDVASVDTREAQRDAHLKSGDFFEVEKFPKMTFRSTRVEKDGSGEVKLAGNLTIRDVTREVVLTVEDEGREKDPWGGDRAGFSATGKIDRRDFGLTWNQALETGGVLVSNEIKLVLDVQAVKAQAEQAA
jgi:polyisoprenoid-binding protein YceI